MGHQQRERNLEREQGCLGCANLQRRLDEAGKRIEELEQWRKIGKQMYEHGYTKTCARCGSEVMGFPKHIDVRDTKLNDDLGGLGQKIFTTAGQGYEKQRYIREDLAGKERIEELEKANSGMVNDLADQIEKRKELESDLAAANQRIADLINMQPLKCAQCNGSGMERSHATTSGYRTCQSCYGRGY